MENPLTELMNLVDTSGEKLGKSSVKLLAICIMLQDVNWELVDKFILKWEVLEIGVAGTKMPLPIVYLSVGGGERKTFVGDETELSEEDQAEMEKLK